MKFRIECADFLCRMLLPLVLVLLAAISAQAQCKVEQTFKLLPDDGAASDRFGRFLAISGNIAIVGATEDDDNGEDSGSAYLFNTTTGQQIAKLLPDDGAAGDRFGSSVAISGTTAIVGAVSDDDNGTDSGSAYLFDTTTGQQIAKLLPNDAAEFDLFGFSVAISGTTAIVGAGYDDDNGTDSGSAYLFETTTGQQIAKLLPNDATELNLVGLSVAISGTTAIVGAGHESYDGDNSLDSGSAYLFNTTTGQQMFKLLADDGEASDGFGLWVGISGTTAIVGARSDDDNGEDSGSAYLFDTTTGQQISKLLPIDGAAVDRFGWSVGISGNIAIVGALRDQDNGANSGSAYLFDTTTGQQITKLLPSDGAAGDLFGRTVAISGTTAIAGAQGNDDNGGQSGSAYLFDVESCDDVVNANQFNIFRGFHIGGDLSDTFDSDDSYLKFNPGFTLNSSEPPVWIEFEGTLPSDNPTSLSITLEAQASTVGLTQAIEVFNDNSGHYELVDSQAATNNDSVVTVDLTDGIPDYVQAGTGAVRTRTGWKQTSLILHFPWTICIDQVVWNVTNQNGKGG